jgi:two-component system NtrC family sensor kinase
MIETVDINAFLLEVVELLEREAKSNGIKFQTVLEKDLPPILSDPSQLQQVCLNLINNATDALERKPYGTIQIHTRRIGRENGIEISIADTGEGIAPENIEKIFDPFFTTKAVGKGTGLGLSICYSIMKQLGGNISVSSEPGNGTEFRLFLPLVPPAELQKNIIAASEDGPPFGALSQRRSP